MAAALAAAPDAPVEDTDNPPTTVGDWDNAITSQSLPDRPPKRANPGSGGRMAGMAVGEGRVPAETASPSRTG